MPGPASDPAIFIHIKVALGMVVSLGIARLLTGTAKFVQHPGRSKPDWIHLAWALSMLLALLHFWWWQYRLAHLTWRFENYLFVMGYAALFYLMCALLFPDDIAEYRGWRDYFLSRRRWFFALFAVSMAIDAVDTLLKGSEHFRSFGLEYPIKLVVYVLLAGFAAATRSVRFHAAFAVGNIVYQLSWILRSFDTIE